MYDQKMTFLGMYFYYSGTRRKNHPFGLFSVRFVSVWRIG